MFESNAQALNHEIEELKTKLAAAESECEEVVAFQRLMCRTFDSVEQQLNGAQVRVWMLATLLNFILEVAHLKQGEPDARGERLTACANMMVTWHNLPDICLEELPHRVAISAREHAAAEGFVVPPLSGGVFG